MVSKYSPLSNRISIPRGSNLGISDRNVSLIKIIFILLLIVGAITLSIWLYFRSISSSSDEKYYFTDSKYQNVKSKFVTRESKYEKVSLEYPITTSVEINNITAEAINKEDESFRQTLVAGRPQFKEPITETASYQITHNDDKFLSIKITVNQDTQGAHPASFRYFWTFDKTNGKILSIRDLLGNSNEAVSIVLSLIKKNIKQEILAETEANLDLDELVTEESIKNFVVGDRNTITWPFGQGKIAPSSYGDIIAQVSVNDIKSFLQNDAAKVLFDVPEPSKPLPENRSISSGHSAGNHNIALTFDDGPGSHTERLLDMLRGRDAKATFYILGSKVKRYSDVIRRIDAEGHQIGNHSWNHPDLTKLGIVDIQSEINRTNDAVNEVIHKKPNTIRPPYGALNNTVLEEIRKSGMISVLWSVDTRDWADRNSTIVCNRAVAGAQPGAIILLHDIHPTSVDAVPCILDTLQKQGYKFVTIDTLLGR